MMRLIALLFGIWLGYMLGQKQPNRHRRVMTAAQTTPTAVTPPAKPDDLTTINGIGPSFAKALNAMGIRTFAQLATQDPDDLAQRMAVRVTADRIRRDKWIEQARSKSENG